MSTHCLGNEFDIHGGGQDLQFPHHENEIAQSEGATCAAFAHLWMHNGFIRVDDEKMSKSLGNFFTVREVLQRYRPEEVRYFILTSHYRSPLNYSEENLDNARNALQRLYLAMRGMHPVSAEGSNPFVDRFHTAMDDDFNTPEALAVLFDLVREINKARVENERRAAQLVGILSQLGQILGLLGEEPEAYLRGGTGGEQKALNTDQIQQLIDAREDARKRKDWQEADRLRSQLQVAGVVLEDKPEGTQWRRV
jgi:cysteinyl-tRNA synthetase